MFFLLKKIYYIYIYITMGGGLMQLVAYGAQDVYLTGNPQITFFKVVYRRHTNFSIESIKQTKNGSDESFSTIVSRNGDLVCNVYLECNNTKGASTQVTQVIDTNDFSSYNQLIDFVEVEIGGQLIDRHDGEIMDMLGNLHKENPTGSGLTLYENNIIRGNMSPGQHKGNNKVWIPMHFWFCRYSGCAIPLIALQYHEVRLNFKLNNAYSTSLPNLNACVWADYIYLDTDERRRFAQVSHEYLIEQVQIQTHTPNQLSGGPTTGKVSLTFNHPVKELIWAWVLKEDDSTSHVNVGKNYTLLGSNLGYFQNGDYDQAGNDFKKFGSIDKLNTQYQLKLNGHDRFAKMDANYFTRLQPWKYHSGGSLNRVAEYNGNLKGTGTTSIRDMCIEHGLLNTDYINVYSFALKPEEHQPSGTCNFSRIDTSELHYKLQTKGGSTASNLSSVFLKVYAVNYNVLRIMSGMGGLAYSN
jgi:hypothetical protein